MMQDGLGGDKGVGRWHTQRGWLCKGKRQLVFCDQRKVVKKEFRVRALCKVLTFMQSGGDGSNLGMCVACAKI